MDSSNKIIKNIFFILVVFVSSAIVSYGINKYKHYNSNKKEMENVISKLDNAVESDKSERTDSEKVYDASQDMISKRLEKTKNGGISEKDKVFSAGVFAGQYVRISITTYNYCKTLNVDISEFVNTYNQRHKNIYLKTEAILKKNGSSIKKVSKSMENTLLKYVKKEINDLRTILIRETGDTSLTLADSCSYFNAISRDPSMMNEVMFSKLSPEAYNILIK